MKHKKKRSTIKKKKRRMTKNVVEHAATSLSNQSEQKKLNREYGTYRVGRGGG